MKVFEINGGTNGSTGKIMFDIQGKINKEGLCVCASPVTSTNRNDEKVDYIKIGGYYSRKVSVFLGKVTGYQGNFAYRATSKLLRDIDNFQPDIVHLHVLHESYINIPALFRYLKEHKNIQVVWTMHDCWAVTAYCPYFTLEKCDKWVSGCYKCSQKNIYPSTYIDRSNAIWKQKRTLFTSIENLSIVTPSKWLKQIISVSFLNKYPVYVINNGINIEKFRPIKGRFRNDYGLKDKFIILGVAFGWARRKGLDVFIEIANRIEDKYKIVLVGTDQEVDKILPNNIISIHRTKNQSELIDIYSEADLFINPTREDNYPTVNMEALSCGLPVITFNTGGSPEIIDESCGRVVDVDDVEQIIKYIHDGNICRDNLEDKCIERSKDFSREKMLNQYYELFKMLIEGK